MLAMEPRLEPVRRVLGAGLELAVPVECGGCGCPGSPWCARCARRVIDDPLPVRPRVEVGTAVWALGRYQGTLRRAVIELKEHRRTDLVPILGEVLARGLVRLADAQALAGAEKCDRLALIPAPTRTLSARRRGGDPVTAVGLAAARSLGPRVAAVPLLTSRAWVRDSAGLTAGGRAANLHGGVVLAHRPPPLLRAGTSARVLIVLIDDVMTTGATAAEAIRVLRSHRIEVAATVVVAAV